MTEMFSRTVGLIGESAVEILQNSHVAVFGLGGVGSYTAEALARSGIGELTLIDSDVVDESNINRQLIATNSTVGLPKTQVCKARIGDINPDCKVNIITGLYLPECRDEFFIGHYDFVADCIDNVTAKLDLALQCQERKIPLISCMGTGNKLHPERLQISDISKTHTCPLCRVIRRELKKIGITKLTVCWSDEEPVVTGNRIPASMTFVPGSAGLLIASRIVQRLANRK